MGVGEEQEIARDLLAGVRDHHQSVITENQNDVIKTLTVIASFVLVPSLIVGFYGQNFGPVFDEGYWGLGVPRLILASTVAPRGLPLARLDLSGARWGERHSSRTSSPGTRGSPRRSLGCSAHGRALVGHGGLGARPLPRPPDPRPRRPGDRGARARLPALSDVLDGFEVYAIGGGRGLAVAAEALAEHHQTWVREPDAGPWRLDIIREPWDGDTWIFRRDRRLRRPVRVIAHTAGGIPYARPEIGLLFKAKTRAAEGRGGLRRRSFLCSTRPGRRWLAEALELAHPAHHWIDMRTG